MPQYEIEERESYGLGSEALVYDLQTGTYLPAWVIEADDAEDMALERDMVEYMSFGVRVLA